MKTLFRALSLIVVAIWVAGCSQTSGNQCAGWKPIRPTINDVQVASQQLVDGLLEHNEYGAKLGCWKGPKR